MPFWKLIIVWILLGVPGWSQPGPTATPIPLEATQRQGAFEIRLRAERDRFELGQSQRLFYRIEGPASAQVELPDPAKIDLKPFELTDSSLSSLPSAGERKAWEVSLKVSAYETGSLELPGLQLLVRQEGETSNTTLVAPELKFQVDRVPAREGDQPDMVRDAKGLSAQGVPLVVWLALLASLALLALLAWLLRRWWNRPRRQAVEPPLEPYPWALRELALLIQSPLRSEQRWQEFYDSLTHILRFYLGWRFQLPLLEQTSSETLRSLSLEDPFHRHLKEILETADLVKFARMDPHQEQVDNQLERARGLIEGHPPAQEGSPTKS